MQIWRQSLAEALVYMVRYHAWVLHHTDRNTDRESFNRRFLRLSKSLSRLRLSKFIEEAAVINPSKERVLSEVRPLYLDSLQYFTEEGF